MTTTTTNEYHVEVEHDPDALPDDITMIARLNRELREASDRLSKDEARFLVDRYYQTQKGRIAAGGQIRAILKGKDKAATPLVLQWFFDQSMILEKCLHSVLGRYAKQQEIGRWLLSVHGIGPVISAGLIAHIDMDFCPSAGHIWSFAGLNPDAKWEKKTRRPWNADLKVLCWKIGQSFLKHSGNPKCVYGHVYIERKNLEIERNEKLLFKSQAEIKAKVVKKTTKAYKYYLKGKLPPAHIDARARRYAVKLFLSHLHGEWHQIHYGRPAPLPYPIAHGDHVHVR